MRNVSYIFSTMILFLVYSVTVAQVITPEQVATIKQVGDCKISDDGRHVAYTLSTPADAFKENSPSQNHLYILNTASGVSTSYYSMSGVSGIAFRPVSGTVTFLAKGKDDQHNSIYEINISGGEARKLYSANATILSYVWHPGGNRLAYCAKEPVKVPATPLAFKPDFYEEEMADQKAYMVSVISNQSEVKPVQVKGTIYHMQWNADGSKLAVSAAPTSSVDDSYMKQQVMIADGNSGAMIAAIDNKGKLGHIAWSPDGKKLALNAGRDIHDPTDGRILIVSSDGGKPEIIDAGFQGKYESIIWDSNEAIHFLASEGTGKIIGSIRPDGSGKQTIYRSADHAITSFSRAKNGMIAFVANTPAHPGELFTLSTARNAKPVKQTNSNSWLAGLKFGKQEVIRYKARDNKYEIEGILIYPVGYQEGKSYPLITVVHGGPEAHYSNGWLTGYSVPGQMAAGAGYAVFYPNYRGSTGRGIDFIHSSQADMAGKEFDDIIDGIDYLISRGITDKSKIGVTGGSYGGYASAWMSTYYSDRFAAAVMFVGISNNLSLWGTSDIPEEMFLVHARKRLWDDWEGFLKTSPVYYVDRAQTPILIMHGAVDPRVHPGQSLELYRHLKVRKPELPVRLIYYPNEGHGNVRSGSRYDYNIRMMQWFDTYLKTGNAKAEKPGLELPVKK